MYTRHTSSCMCCDSNYLEYIAAFEVFLWPALLFIIPVVGLLRSTVMVRTLKAVTGFAVETALACVCSSTPVKPASQQHRLWYAYNTKTGGILAYTFSPGTDATCCELLALLAPFKHALLIGCTASAYVFCPNLNNMRWHIMMMCCI